MFHYLNIFSELNENRVSSSMPVSHITCDLFHHCMTIPKIPDGLCNLQIRVTLHHVTRCHSGFQNWRALLNTIIIFRVSKIVGNFLSSYATMRISRRNLFCGVNYILVVVIDSPVVLFSVHQNFTNNFILNAN